MTEPTPGYDTYLFIGGPCDGQTRSVANVNLTCRVPYIPDGMITEDLVPAEAQYRRERLSGLDELALRRTFDVFILESMPTAKAIKKLIENYLPGESADV